MGRRERGGPASASPPQASVTRVSAPHLCPTNSCGAPQAIRFGLVEDAMGLYVHSIGELPTEAYRSYYVYLLDYGWDETFGEAVRSNLPRMADAASRSDAVVIHGPRGMHFEDEVLSWHDINGSPADDILPAILVTTGHPRTFREVFGPSARFRAPADALLLIPLRKTCKTPDDVVTLIDRLFRDVAGKKGTLRLCGEN